MIVNCFFKTKDVCLKLELKSIFSYLPPKLINYSCFKILPRHTSASTLSCFKADLRLLTINPAFEKIGSAGVDVAEEGFSN